MKDEVHSYENKYRGKELPGFINYKTFETIVRRQIMTLKSPAVEMLTDVAGTFYSSNMVSVSNIRFM